MDIIYLIAAFFGGVFSLWLFYRSKWGGFQAIANNLIHSAEMEAEKIRQRGEIDLREQRKEFEIQKQEERNKLQNEEARLKKREDKLETRMNLVEKKLSDTEKREAILIKRREKLEEERIHVKFSHEQLVKNLEKISGLTSSEARSFLLNEMKKDVEADAANLIRRTIKEAEEEADQQASKIIATAISRLAAPCVSEATVNTVTIPSDEMKGRIIGREGRNIRMLERETGVNFIIDDTPGAVVLSGFDPIRLHVAKVALTDLVADGRIHPTRIEEAVQKAQETTKKKIRKYGEEAALRANQVDLHPEIITLLGKLKFRYSYGQNILEHSLEVSSILGMMAAELGLDVQRAKRIGLLHDMGKAVTHEMEGTHAMIGHNLALKYGESEEVANGIGCHHNEIPPTTIEGSLCGAADAVSAARPGARIEAVEEYTKRLRKLEDIAYEFPGVEKAYALQAGREIRITVLPDMIDDDGTLNLARDLTKRIEKELRYPGKIKVTVVREKRITEYAL